MFTDQLRQSVHTGGMRPARWSVSRQLLALQSALLAVVVLAAAVTAFEVSRRRDISAARDKVLAIAESVADNPWVAEQAATTDPSRQLEPYAERIRLESHVDFIVVMAPNRTRWSHPDRTQLGKPFIGTIAPALQGRTFTETHRGTLGPSVRAVAPVHDPHGSIVALVAVGITTAAIHEQLLHQLPLIALGLVVLLAIALAGSLLVSRRLRRQTHGVDAQTLSQMFAAQEAVLHSIREGLVVTGRDGRIGLVNDEARRLLDLDGDVAGQHVDDLPIGDSVRQLLRDGRPAEDELHLTEARVLVINQLPSEWAGRRYGTVTTLRDRTELEALTGELDTTKAFAESLRSQAHETANRLHTMIVLIETGRGEEAVRYATSELELSQRLADRIMSEVDEPVLAALLLGKTAQAAERGITLTVEAHGHIADSGVAPRDLVTVFGNLVDNAMDAAAESVDERKVNVEVVATDDGIEVSVADSGPGLPADLVTTAFTRGWSTKAAAPGSGRGLGLALVHQVVRRYGGSVDVDTSPAGGAVFHVRLPVRRTADAR